MKDNDNEYSGITKISFGNMLEELSLTYDLYYAKIVVIEIHCLVNQKFTYPIIFIT